MSTSNKVYLDLNVLYLVLYYPPLPNALSGFVVLINIFLQIGIKLDGVTPLVADPS